MRTLLSVSIAALLLLSIGCKKEPPPAPWGEEERFVPGDVLVGISQDIRLEDVFDSLNYLNLKIIQMDDFEYLSDYPKDSIIALINLLNKKPYINYFDGRFQWKATTSNVFYLYDIKKIMIYCSEFDMTLPNQEDFLNLIDSLKLNPKKSSNRSMALKVPVGTEKYWVAELKKKSFVRWADVNKIIEIEFY